MEGAFQQDPRVHPGGLTVCPQGFVESECFLRRGLRAGTITVTQGLTTLTRGVIVQESKTKSGKRTVPLLPEVVEEFKAWRKKWLEEKLALGLTGQEPIWSPF
ncbi:hypothetical protein ACP6EK_08485 [Candidatus Caldatribacterium sp. SIUC1]|uniref:hypothetical protein n=1 Tax=Candidatus Caldatribacterium sp. SIUC1 TaxID=3418365 RepID=UPI003F6902FB